MQVTPQGLGQRCDDLEGNHGAHHGSFKVGQHQVLLSQLLVSLMKLEAVHDRARGQSLLVPQILQTGFTEESLSASTVVVTVLIFLWN